MAQHTPGPWKHAGRRGGWDGVTSADGTDICHLEYNNPSNATLIAAAPDMLAILQDSVEILDVAIESREELTGEEDEVMRDLRARVRAAIARAEG